MNIEESMKVLKHFRNYNKFYKEENKNLTIIITSEAKESIDKAIERLLTAYEKEKGENVKLRLQDIPLIEGELKAYKDRVNELKQEVEKEKEKNKKINKYIEDRVKIGKDIQTFINEDYVEQEYISKDKIKAKIEEYKKQQKEETDAYLCIKVLLSLLEKE